jgi:cytoskeleton protein RodZ
VGSPGRRLWEAREARHWTQQDVASQLHLSPEVISALERDDYSNLPPPAYVRGYLRSYARLLDMPEAMISDAYQRLQIETPGREFDRKRAVRQATIRDRRVRWMTYLVVLAVVTLPIIWWQTQGSFRFWEALPAASAPRGQPAGHDVAAPAAAPSPGVATPSAPPATTDIAPLEVGDMGAVTSAAGAPAADASEVAAAETAEMDTEPDAGTDSALSEQPPSDTAPSPQPPAASQPAAADEPIKPDQLVLRARADSWVSVIDADRRRLIYRVLSAGSEQTLKGRAPFRVVLGNPNGVSVDYNGNAVDAERYAREGVARFEVGSGHE